MKIKNNIYFIFFTIIIACSSPTETKQKKIKLNDLNKKIICTKKNTISKNQLVDSLIKYSSLNKFLLRDNEGQFVLYITKINNTKIGFIAMTDSTLFFYQKVNNNWVLNDSIDFNSYAFSYKALDLNGNNKNDFVIYSYPNMHVQSIPFVFICDDKNHFNYRKNIKLYNISYDPQKKLVKSFYEGGVCSVHHKALHKWKNDSLIIVEKVELNLSDHQSIETKYYKEINGKFIN